MTIYQFVFLSHIRDLQLNFNRNVPDILAAYILFAAENEPVIRNCLIATDH